MRRLKLTILNFFDRLRSKLILGTPVYYGGRRERVTIHPTAIVNNALFNAVSGNIQIGEFVFFGHNVSILTGTHDINQKRRARQRAVTTMGRDIIIHEGAWIASNVTVLGPVEIGHDAVICAGAVVNRDVSPNTIVGGVPAKVIGVIAENEQVIAGDNPEDTAA